jgi:hypothetical protein
MKILVINGPNINMLGIREKDIYGSTTFKSLIETCIQTGKELNVFSIPENVITHSFLFYFKVVFFIHSNNSEYFPVTYS